MSLRTVPLAVETGSITATIGRTIVTPPDKDVVVETDPDNGVFLVTTPEKNVVVETDPNNEVCLDNTPEKDVAATTDPDNGVFLDNAPDKDVVAETDPDNEVCLDNTPLELATPVDAPSNSLITPLSTTYSTTRRASGVLGSSTVPLTVCCTPLPHVPLKTPFMSQWTRSMKVVSDPGTMFDNPAAFNANVRLPPVGSAINESDNRVSLNLL